MMPARDVREARAREYAELVTDQMCERLERLTLAMQRAPLELTTRFRNVVARLEQDCEDIDAESGGLAMNLQEEPLWKTDVREAARVLLKKIKNTEVITIAGLNIEAGFELHHGRLTCNDEELLRSVAEFVLEVEDSMFRLRDRVAELEKQAGVE